MVVLGDQVWFGFSEETAASIEAAIRSRLHLAQAPVPGLEAETFSVPLLGEFEARGLSCRHSP
jgi:hypothetical protein